MLFTHSNQLSFLNTAVFYWQVMENVVSPLQTIYTQWLVLSKNETHCSTVLHRVNKKSTEYNVAAKGQNTYFFLPFHWLETCPRSLIYQYWYSCTNRDTHLPPHSVKERRKQLPEMLLVWCSYTPIIFLGWTKQLRELIHQNICCVKRRQFSRWG